MKLIKNKIFLIICSVIIIAIVGIAIYFVLGTDQKINQSNLRNENIYQVEIMNEYINIRADKSTDASILGKVFKGEIYTVLSEEDNTDYHWIEIETANGIRGYISGIDGYVKKLEVIKEDENEILDDEVVDTETNDKPNSNNTSTENKKPIVDESENNKKPTIENNTDNNKIPTTDNNTISNVNTKDDLEQDIKEPDNNDNKTEEKPKEEVFDATIEYYCTIGDLTKYNTCSGYEYLDQIATYSCPSGYKLNTKTNNCDFIKQPDVAPTKQPYCYSGTLVYVDGQYICNSSTGNSSVMYKDKCPDGYELVKGGTVLGVYVSVFCTHTLNNTSIKPDNDCPEGYKGVSADGRCMKSFTGLKANTKYTCPSGYTLKENKCYK